MPPEPSATLSTSVPGVRSPAYRTRQTGERGSHGGSTAYDAHEAPECVLDSCVEDVPDRRTLTV